MSNIWFPANLAYPYRGSIEKLLAEEVKILIVRLHEDVKILKEDQ